MHSTQLLLFYLVESFHPCSNIPSHVKASMVLTIADHLFIQNDIRSLLNNILILILLS